MNYGAVPDGTTFITAAMQKVRWMLPLAAGGGTVEVPAGDFLCGPFTIGSNIRLQLDAGAKLLLPPYGKYPGGFHPSAFIIGKDVHDLEFCGPGLLDGHRVGAGGPPELISRTNPTNSTSSIAPVFTSTIGPPSIHQ